MKLYKVTYRQTLFAEGLFEGEIAEDAVRVALEELDPEEIIDGSFTVEEVVV